MKPNRLEAFSDGVIAIIVTIMVLELKAPHEPTVAALLEVAPIFLFYILSFVVVAAMWINHHYLIHLVKAVSPKLLWVNNVLLFWMSLIPFVTAYMGENHDVPLAVAAYGVVLTLTSLAYTWLHRVAAQQDQSDPELAKHHQDNVRQAMVSTVLYALSVPLAFVSVYASFAIFVLIPIIYFLPRRRAQISAKVATP
jgi:uncharacterized membrane protein